MQLHTVENRQADWENVPADQRNFWQRIAARTKGWLTPGNVVTGAGTGFVGTGLYEFASGRPWLGLGMMVVGRVADLIDGAVAHSTGTKSPIGEALDAGLDKVQALGAFAMLTYEGVLPWSATAALAVPQLATAGVSAVAKRRGREIHPRAPGKIGMFTAWASAFSFTGSWLVQRGTEIAAGFQDVAARVLEYGGVGTAAATVACGIVAVAGYCKDAFGSSPQESVSIPLPAALPEQTE